MYLLGHESKAQREIPTYGLRQNKQILFTTKALPHLISTGRVIVVGYHMTNDLQLPVGPESKEAREPRITVTSEDI